MIEYINHTKSTGKIHAVANWHEKKFEKESNSNTRTILVTATLKQNFNKFTRRKQF